MFFNKEAFKKIQKDIEAYKMIEDELIRIDKDYIEAKRNERNDGLTEQEGVVMDSLVNAWNEYIKLEKEHPSDLEIFGNGIHTCQQMLAMRIVRRDYPLGYPRK